jgi:hypothetical protein
VREHFWYDPFDPQDLAGFALTDAVYQPIGPDGRGRLVSPLLGLALARWRGTYQDVDATWLRWETPDGTLLPTRAEAQARRADREAQRAQQANQRADTAEAEVARLRALLAEKE